MAVLTATNLTPIYDNHLRNLCKSPSNIYIFYATLIIQNNLWTKFNKWSCLWKMSKASFWQNQFFFIHFKTTFSIIKTIIDHTWWWSLLMVITLDGDQLTVWKHNQPGHLINYDRKYKNKHLRYKSKTKGFFYHQTNCVCFTLFWEHPCQRVTVGRMMTWCNTLWEEVYLTEQPVQPHLHICSDLIWIPKINLPGLLTANGATS